MESKSPERGSTEAQYTRHNTVSPSEISMALLTDPQSGLTRQEVEQRQRLYGLNELKKSAAPRLWTLILHQFQSSVIYLLGMAIVVSLALREFMQAAGILAVIAINAAIGIVLEYRANASLAKLTRLAGAFARVRRSNREMYVPTVELVPGDIVMLDSGQRIPADLHILECASLSVDESTLTGESTPVYKEALNELNSASQNAEPSELFQGTVVLSGRAIAVVTATGADASLGRLGRALTEIENAPTPLEQQLGRLGDFLTKLTLVVCAVVGVVGLALKQPFFDMLETSVTLAVAAIPEALPLIATLAMAVGIQRMNRSRALIRRLPAVETLGCTTVICTDKTGTLTENKMTLTTLILDKHQLTLSGSGYDPAGQLEEDASPVSAKAMVDARSLLSAAALCNDAKLENEVDEGGWHVHGDPTEGALLTAAEKIGISCEQLKQEYPRLAEVPFDLKRKMMSTTHNHSGDSSGPIAFVKGAPEMVLAKCTFLMSEGETVRLTEDSRKHFLEQNNRLAQTGLRVLAIASHHLSKEGTEPSAAGNFTIYDTAVIERDLTLLGLVGLADRPKQGVNDAVARCREAGVRIVMLTGDQLATASAIAAELGITDPQIAHQTLDATCLPNNGDANVSDLLEKATVFARTSPESKLRIVKLLQRAGEVVAMTGDGVNDAPALKQADIGIAMGATGTEMAREASSLVITDDNISTIVKAIEHGRITYDNIRRCVAYLLTASLTSVMVVTLGIVTGSGLMLKPLQLLALNLIMHVFPALGLVVQTYDRGLMQKGPRPRTADIVGPAELTQIVLRSSMISIVVLYCVLNGMFAAHATTAVLFAVSVCLVAQSWLWLAKPIKLGQMFNWPMLLCTFLGMGILLGSVYWKPLAFVLDTAPLTSNELQIISLMTAAIMTMTILLRKVGSTTSDADAIRQTRLTNETRLANVQAETLTVKGGSGS